MKFLHLSLLSLLAAFLFGCGAGVGDFMEKLSGDYYLQRLDSSKIFIAKLAYTPGQSPMIPSYVVEYAYDEDFIIGKQKAVSPLGNEYNYWVIDVKEDKAFGPYPDKSEFLNHLRELNVPPSLRLAE